jgi:hypothetical protein
MRLIFQPFERLCQTRLGQEMVQPRGDLAAVLRVPGLDGGGNLRQRRKLRRRLRVAPPVVGDDLKAPLKVAAEEDKISGHSSSEVHRCAAVNCRARRSVTGQGGRI